MIQFNLNKKIAYFITPHGFGHASRAAAVMEALLRRDSKIRFELFTTCPIQMFRQAIGNDFGYHPIQTDIGMVQLSPLKEDVTATCDRLDHLLPFDRAWVVELAQQLKRLDCDLVICDIAPLGIEVARSAGLPSILIENFTWDWLYQRYSEQKKRFSRHIAYLADIVRRVDYHIQTPPLCQPSNRATFIGPISRNARLDRSQVRKKLGVDENDQIALISMGGVPDQFEFISKIPSKLDCHIVIPGASDTTPPHEKIILLPTHSSFFHPDLMVAADVLVGKAGYSTVAEAYQTGIPFGYIRRPQSPESAVLEAFIRHHMPSMAIPTNTYHTGEWIDYLPNLLSLPRGQHRIENGADEAASYISQILDR